MAYPDLQTNKEAIQKRQTSTYKKKLHSREWQQPHEWGSQGPQLLCEVFFNGVQKKEVFGY